MKMTVKLQHKILTKTIPRRLTHQADLQVATGTKMVISTLIKTFQAPILGQEQELCARIILSLRITLKAIVIVNINLQLPLPLPLQHQPHPQTQMMVNVEATVLKEDVNRVLVGLKKHIKTYHHGAKSTLGTNNTVSASLRTKVRETVTQLI
jgi:hypothetical protein